MPSALPFWSKAKDKDRAKTEAKHVDHPAPPPPNNNDRPNPESEASWLSRVLFVWVGLVLKTGDEACRVRGGMEAEELFALHPNDEATHNFTQFQRAWSEEEAACKARGSHDKEPPQAAQSVALRSVLVRQFKSSWWFTGVLKYINDVVQFVLPLVLLRLLKGLGDPGTSRVELYGVAFLMFALTAFRVTIENHYFYHTFRLGAQLGGAVSCQVYHKALALAPSARQSRSSGELVNYMQLDANKLMMFTQSAHVLWSGLHQIIGYTVVLYTVISWSALVGVALLVVLIPIQGVLQVSLMRYRGQANKHTDARIKLTNEILQGIKTIKMYGWEESFARAMAHIRSLELSQLRKLAMVSAVNTAIFMCTPAFATVITFVVYTAVQGQSFSAAQAFTAVTLFNSLRFPLIFYPAVLAQYAGVKLSLARLDAFFALEEIDPTYFETPSDVPSLTSPLPTGAGDAMDGPTVPKTPTSRSSQAQDPPTFSPSPSPKSSSGRRKAQAPVALHIKDGDFSWAFMPKSDTASASPEAAPASPALTLCDANLTVHKGELVAVVGRVSRGKSTLCAALLGELKKWRGSVMVKGSVAYVPQSPWIFNATLRDNILFGRAYEEELYQRVLSACALSADVKMLRLGDMTEIGERGINLSGGQKQRVAIARAVYSQADVLIMDDPLSALDAHVCKHVFESCLRGPLLRGRTVLLATNQLQFVAQTDYVIVLANHDGDKEACHIAQQGTYKQLMDVSQDAVSPGSSFKTLMQELGLKDRGEEEAEHEAEEETPAPQAEPPKRAPDALLSMAVSPKPVAVSNGKELTKSEAREKGSVPLSTYITYVKAAQSLLLVALMLSSFGLASAADKISQWWISYWAEDASFTRHPLALYLVLFLVLNIAVAVLTSVRTVLFAVLGQRTAKHMHTALTHSVLAAPLAWFDSTPTGRIVNRFSSDLSTLDEALPTTMAMFLNMLLSLLATIATIAILLPWVLLGLLPLGVYYASVLRYYNTSNRELKRLDSVSKSPIFSLFGETLQGLASIRAFKKEPFYSNRITSLIDGHRRAYMSMMALQRWLGLRIELIANMLILVVALICIAQRGVLPAALAALALSQATFTTGMLNFVIRMAADTEAQMNSVERVLEFSTKLPQEQQTITLAKPEATDVEQSRRRARTAAQQLPASWPSEGSVVFKDYKLRYREGLDLALKGISLSVEGGEKVGVCGRTGSGKSTLMLALLRLVEGAEGGIEVDGWDIKHVPLQTLRNKVSIIPQEAVLFSGTFRYNLDPFDAYTDEQIWTALEKVHLKATVSALPGKLQTMVSEGGENFSLGQRQLVCLARALLRRSHILLLDEATASVDFETDVLVQKTVRTEFSHCTVLTIAHRLNTIIDSDKVLVLDGGVVAEFGPPHELLQREGSTAVFRSLVDETGPDYAATLKQQAAQAYESYLQRPARLPRSDFDAKDQTGPSDEHKTHEKRRSSCVSLVDIPLE